MERGMGWLDLFQNLSANSSTAVTQQKVDNAPAVSNQYALRQEMNALSAGDIISGKVMERSNDQVKLLVNLLQGDTEIEAKISQNIALSMGKNLVFQVKSNANGLMLSPLFENMGMEENGKKALSMAGIPENEKSLLLVSSMMKEGISIDKNTISEYYHQSVQFKDADLMDIIDLHRIQMPVNQQNLEQIASYKNMTHQLSGAIDDMAAELPGTLSQMLESGNEGEALKVFVDLVKGYVSQVDLSEEGMALPESEEGKQAVGTEQEVLEQKVSDSKVLDSQILDSKVSGQNPLDQEATVQNSKAEGHQEIVGTLPLEMDEADASVGLPEIGVENMNHQRPEDHGVSNSGSNSGINNGGVVLQSVINEEDEKQTESKIGFKDLLNNLKELSEEWDKGVEQKDQTAKILKSLLQKTEGRDFLQKMFSENLRIKPEETDREGVKRLFQSMDKQLQNLSDALHNAQMSDSNLGKMVQSTQQNLEFLDQVNQMYAYMQLPIKLTGQDTNSDLYVYTNKKNFASSDGEVSAFLHLDMQNLGPVDCLVKMQDQKVSTKFTLQDEEMLNFMQDHMDILTQRLANRGYDLSVKMGTKDQQEDSEDKNGVFHELIMRQSNVPGASNLSFDVRT